MNYDYEALIAQQGYLTVLSNIAGCIERDNEPWDEEGLEYAEHEAKRLIEALSAKKAQ